MNFNKSTLRYLSLGFFISAVLLSGYGLMAPDSSLSSEEHSYKEMYEELAAEETSSIDSISVQESTIAEETDTSTSESSAAADPENETGSEEDNTGESQETEENNQENSADGFTTVIVINEGDPSSFASNQLRNQGIIESATEFNDFLEENDYTSQIRPGSYEVTTEMSFQEIAEVLMSGN